MIKGFPSTMNDDWQLNLWKILKHAATVHRSGEVVSYRNLQGGKIHRLSYREVYERASAMANALEGLGVRPGDRIAILGWNDHRYLESYHSVSGVGAVLLQLNLRLHPRELIYIAGHAGAKALFVDETLLPLAEAIAREHRFDFHVIMSDRPVDEIKTSLSPVYGYEELIISSPRERRWEDIDERSAAAACYTSGTTGMPKGVFYSHRALILHAMAYLQAAPMMPHDAFLQIVPLFHVNGWGLFLTAEIAGAKLVLPGRYTPQSLVDIMAREKITITAGAPTVLLSVLEVLRSVKDPPNLNVRALSGGSEPPLALVKGLAKYGIKVIHVYGATETTDGITASLPKPQILEKPLEEQEEYVSKQGLPLFGVEVKLVVPSSGEELPWDGRSVGELLVRGPYIAREYYKDPRTREAFTPDGYWRTGDAGTIDELGYFKITDRVKDLINSGGEWISSIDLENHLMAHPMVLEAAVVGIPHPRWGERPLALVVLRPEHRGRPVNEIVEDLRKHLMDRFARWQIPDEFIFVEEIPKTSVGKFAKRVIREQYNSYYLTKHQVPPR